MNSITDASRKLAKIIRLYEQDEISTEKFRSLVYGISKYGELINKEKLEEIEKKIAELEREFNVHR